MNTTLITLLFAIGLVLLSAIGMGIGKLLTGKTRFLCKRCGTPEKDKKNCEVCQKPHCKKKKDPGEEQ